MQDGPMPVVCPLTTPQLVDVLMAFMDVFNEPAGIYIYSYQKNFIRRIIECVLNRDGDVITGLFSRQAGKSEALACLATCLCIMFPTLAKSFPDDPRLIQYREGFFIGIFAPKEKQAAIIYDRIRKRAERDTSQAIYADPDIQIGIAKSRGDMIAWTNGSFVVAQTASEQSSVEGFTYHIIFIDEAQLVSKHKVSKELAPMLAATNGPLIKIGTANALRGGFKESILYNIDYEKKGGPRNHFEYPYDLVIQEKRRAYEASHNDFHLNYEKFIANELRRLNHNKDNEEFRQNFRLLWQEADLLAIDPEAFAACADYGAELVYSCFNKRIVAGLDYARKRDATILTIMEVEDEPIPDNRSFVRLGDEQPVFLRKRVLCWYEIQGRRWHDILGHVVEICSSYAVQILVSDGTGIGDPLTEQLQALMPGTRIQPFMMSHVGNDIIYKFYIQEIEAQRLVYPAGPITRETSVFKQFSHEHSQLIKDRVGIYIRCFSPEGEHDDFCDSTALACHASTIPVEPQVVEDYNPFYGSRLQSASSGDRSSRYRR